MKKFLLSLVFVALAAGSAAAGPPGCYGYGGYGGGYGYGYRTSYYGGPVYYQPAVAQRTYLYGYGAPGLYPSRFRNGYGGYAPGYGGGYGYGGYGPGINVRIGY